MTVWNILGKINDEVEIIPTSTTLQENSISIQNASDGISETLWQKNKKNKQTTFTGKWWHMSA